MKLIIDISESGYESLKETNVIISAPRSGKTLMSMVYNAVAHGIPLDDVKAEIAEEICLTDNPYTKETKYTIEHLRLLEILDNIGKAESEGEKTKHYLCEWKCAFEVEAQDENEAKTKFADQLSDDFFTCIYPEEIEVIDRGGKNDTFDHNPILQHQGIHRRAFERAGKSVDR